MCSKTRCFVNALDLDEDQSTFYAKLKTVCILFLVTVYPNRVREIGPIEFFILVAPVEQPRINTRRQTLLTPFAAK